MEEEICGCSEGETSDVEVYDSDYEFDAARYFDFSRPETRWEKEEAERWFDYAPTYPPSPFMAKLTLGKLISSENVKKVQEAQDLEHQEDSSPIDIDIVVEEVTVSERKPDNDDKNPLKAGAKVRSELSAWRSSGYMKPTASYLAKQNQSQEFQFNRILRSQYIVNDHRSSSRSSSSTDIEVTKRQKLDTGYLQKITHTKSRSYLQHKPAKIERKDDDWILGRPKVTTPREFFLETARRALRDRPKNKCDSIGHKESNFPTSKMRASNHKVHSVLHMKKSTIQLPDVQEFKLPATKQPPPVELFENLSIDSEIQPYAKYQLKSKPPTEMVDTFKEKPLRSSVKQFQCRRDTGIPKYGPEASFNRSLDIR